jgi:hypothetical protein
VQKNQNADIRYTIIRNDTDQDRRNRDTISRYGMNRQGSIYLLCLRPFSPPLNLVPTGIH